MIYKEALSKMSAVARFYVLKDAVNIAEGYSTEQEKYWRAGLIFAGQDLEFIEFCLHLAVTYDRKLLRNMVKESERESETIALDDLVERARKSLPKTERETADKLEASFV